jgi:hypothetical protein
MKLSDGTPDATPPGPDDTAASPGAEAQGREGVQDILDLIDKLAEVTQQLRTPHHSSGLASQAP